MGRERLDELRAARRCALQSTRGWRATSREKAVQARRRYPSPWLRKTCPARRSPAQTMSVCAQSCGKPMSASRAANRSPPRSSLRASPTKAGLRMAPPVPGAHRAPHPARWNQRLASEPDNSRLPSAPESRTPLRIPPSEQRRWLEPGARFCWSSVSVRRARVKRLIFLLVGSRRVRRGGVCAFDGVGAVRADAQPYLGPRPCRAAGRRHDGLIWGDPAGRSFAAARSLEAVHADVAAGRCREPAAVHRCVRGLRAQDRFHAGCSASSPSSRRVW